MNEILGKIRHRVCKCAALSAQGMQSSTIDYTYLLLGVELVAQILGIENTELHRSLNRQVAWFVRLDRWRWFGPAIFALTRLYVSLVFIEVRVNFETARSTLLGQDVYAGARFRQSGRLWLTMFFGVGRAWKRK